MSQFRTTKAQKPLEVTLITKKEAAQLSEADKVPMYFRVKNDEEPVLMGWARRDAVLRGAEAIYVRADGVTDVIYRDSDA
jgi:hypothetical protein